MKNSKYTPGPWRVLYSSNTYPSVHAGETNSPICPLYEYVAEGQRDLLDNADANAQLIAAAPDMLEALMQIDSILLSATAETATSAIRQCFAITTSAVAKARGEK